MRRDMEEFLNALIKSLCMIEVKGKDNMNILLGCILAAEEMKAKLAANAVQENASKKEEGE